VLAVLDPQPLLAPEDLALILWAADYYRHPIGEALFSALPARLRRPQPLLDPRPRGWRLTSAGRAQDPHGLRRAPRQAAVLARLGTAPAGLAGADLTCDLGDCAPALRALAAKGWVEPCLPAPAVAAASPAPGPRPNPEQAAALARIRGSSGFRTFLLDGVTGSGKTEVYLHLIRDTLAAGRQALVLVPEIGLTPQLERRLRTRLGAPMAVLHSGLAERERELAWRAAASGAAGLVLGTRSAVFAPLPRLGLVVVDEEHDLSFKQQDGFRYSARDLAVRRAQRAGCPAVLGSATPALETLQNARTGRYDWLRLAGRAGGASPPRLDLLDIRAQPLAGGLSRVLVRDIQTEVAAGNQVLLFLNRRGFAPILTCHDCGWVGGCPHCDARLTLHLDRRRLACHHCGWTRAIPRACPDCAKDDLRPLGQGTERLEAEVERLFPGVPMARIDRDSTRGGRLAGLLEGARRGDYPILIGTQMLAKGHHLPGVTLVGILDLDQGLYGADYRAPERMAQLIVQVAGRAGRAERPGRVVLQTRHPDHPLLAALLGGGYAAFAEGALAERRAALLPPFSHQALLRAEGRTAQDAADLLTRAAALARGPGPAGLALWGPVPAPMERRAGRYRAQLLVQAERRAGLQAFLAAWVPGLRGLRVPAGVRWSLDVDPQEMV
jgi:primosomal protein N' (replication factor Y)